MFIQNLEGEMRKKDEERRRYQHLPIFSLFIKSWLR